LGFQVPGDVAAFNVVERLEGNSTTDFGAPAMPLACDGDSIGEDEQQWFRAVLRACWTAFDEAVQMAEGKDLRKGPRGGGRDLDKIVDHVVGADVSYLGRLG
jgi:hypothetical protein